jgi:hypothetical protein
MSRLLRRSAWRSRYVGDIETLATVFDTMLTHDPGIGVESNCAPHKWLSGMELIEPHVC